MATSLTEKYHSKVKSLHIIKMALLNIYYIFLQILAYEELFKFLNLLGTVFGWVASDIDAKMEILRGLKNGEQSEKYLTVQSMIQYEVDNNLIKYKAKDSSTGTRNLLRLHRALEYIAAFLDGKT